MALRLGVEAELIVAASPSSLWALEYCFVLEMILGEEVSRWMANSVWAFSLRRYSISFSLFTLPPTLLSAIALLLAMPRSFFCLGLTTTSITFSSSTSCSINVNLLTPSSCSSSSLLPLTLQMGANDEILLNAASARSLSARSLEISSSNALSLLTFSCSNLCTISARSLSALSCTLCSRSCEWRAASARSFSDSRRMSSFWSSIFWSCSCCSVSLLASNRSISFSRSRRWSCSCSFCSISS